MNIIYAHNIDFFYAFVAFQLKVNPERLIKDINKTSTNMFINIIPPNNPNYFSSQIRDMLTSFNNVQMHFDFYWSGSHSNQHLLLTTHGDYWQLSILQFNLSHLLGCLQHSSCLFLGHFFVALIDIAIIFVAPFNSIWCIWSHFVTATLFQYSFACQSKRWHLISDISPWRHLCMTRYRNTFYKLGWHFFEGSCGSLEKYVGTLVEGTNDSFIGYWVFRSIVFNGVGFSVE